MWIWLWCSYFNIRRQNNILTIQIKKLVDDNVANWWKKKKKTCSIQMLIKIWVLTFWMMPHLVGTALHTRDKRLSRCWIRPFTTLTWFIWCSSLQPVQPQYYYGPNFGYIVAFKQQGSNEWMKVTVADPQAKRYVHKDSSIPSSTQFQVKVKAFNSEGEGPFSLTADIYSAQDGKRSQERFTTETNALWKRRHRSTWSCFSQYHEEWGILQYANTLLFQSVIVSCLSREGFSMESEPF